MPCEEHDSDSAPDAASLGLLCSEETFDGGSVENLDGSADDSDTAGPGAIGAQGPLRSEGCFELGPDEALPEHPAAGLLPLSRLEEMVESIRWHAQLAPGVVFQDELGQQWLLDGRRRRHACRALERPFRYQLVIDLGGRTPEEWVVANLMAGAESRRLSDSQRAIVGARLYQAVFGPAARQRMLRGKRAPEAERERAYKTAGRHVNVSGNAIRQAVKVIAYEDLVREVFEQRLPLSVAAQLAKKSNPAARQRALAEYWAKRRRPKNGPVLSDALGNRVPASLQPVFREVDSVNRCLAQFQASLQQLGQAQSGPLSRTFAAIDLAPLQTLLDHVEAARPAAVCMRCLGEECPTCQGSGWLTWHELAARSLVHGLEVSEEPAQELALIRRL